MHPPTHQFDTSFEQNKNFTHTQLKTIMYTFKETHMLIVNEPMLRSAHYA